MCSWKVECAKSSVYLILVHLSLFLTKHLTLSRRRCCWLVVDQASSEEELYAWMVPLRVLVGSHNLVRTGAAGSMCYVDVARRADLVNTRNRFVASFCRCAARASCRRPLGRVC